MKLFKILLCSFSLFLVSFFRLASAQENFSVNYYKSIKLYDVSKLWAGDKINFFDDDKITAIDFPEPLGFIGKNYQRFYIHYTSVTKDPSNPFRYLVKGKTRVKNSICNFHGIITVIKAFISSDPYTDYKPYSKYTQGDIISHIILFEDKSQNGSGFISGTLTTSFFIDRKHHIFYDTLDSEADGFCNNQCEAMWTSYIAGKREVCNWGDYRIPKSNNLDDGAGEFMISQRYVNNGWCNYMQSIMGEGKEQKKAALEENRKWWE